MDADTLDQSVVDAMLADPDLLADIQRAVTGGFYSADGHSLPSGSTQLKEPGAASDSDSGNDFEEVLPSHRIGTTESAQRNGSSTSGATASGSGNPIQIDTDTDDSFEYVEVTPIARAADSAAAPEARPTQADDEPVKSAPSYTIDRVVGSAGEAVNTQQAATVNALQNDVAIHDYAQAPTALASSPASTTPHKDVKGTDLPPSATVAPAVPQQSILASDPHPLSATPMPLAEADGAADMEDEELDNGPSLVSAALNTHDSDSDSDDLIELTHQPSAATASLPGLRRPPPKPMTPASAILAPAVEPIRNQLVAHPPFRPSIESPIQATSASVQSALTSSTSSTFTDASAKASAEASRVTSSSPTTRVTDEMIQEMPVSDDDVPVDWSRSPSPQQPARPKPVIRRQSSNLDEEVPDDFPLAPAGRELEEDEEDAEDLETIETQVNLQAEEGHFFKFLKELQSRNLDEMRNEVEEEIRVLNQQRKTDRRNADDVTAQMSKEIQVSSQGIRKSNSNGLSRSCCDCSACLM